jgi:hypothetical protein
LITTLGLTVDNSASATHWPLDAGKFDAALAQGPSLSPSDVGRVKQSCTESKALRESGKHGQSVEEFSEAMQTLGIS